MQVNVKTEEKKFHPVQLNITFETEEELHSFITMTGFNHTVADIVRCRFSEDAYPGNFSYEALRKMLGNLNCAMCHVLPDN